MNDHQTARHEADNLKHGHSGPGAATRAAAAGVESSLATDPVCGMTVDPTTSKHLLEHQGVTFHFCSAGCRAKFAAAPESYLKPKAAVPAPAKVGAVYTCPMHPEIRQQGPGSCPICGMALEPLEVSPDAAPNEELLDMTRRIWVGPSLLLPRAVPAGGFLLPRLGRGG